MDVTDGLSLLLEQDDEDTFRVEDLFQDSPPGCLFCRLGELEEGEDD
jgi:hypothetical protein